MKTMIKMITEAFMNSLDPGLDYVSQAPSFCF